MRKLLDLILLTAVKAQASDIHFEPFEDTFRVRNRIDGVLYEMLPVPKALAPALVARIKVMSHLDIAERRLPQDGKISVTIGGRTVDLRVSTLPTMFGESVVIRVLDRSVVSLDLDKIGMPDEDLTLLPRGHQEAERHRGGHRPDRFGQDHHAVRGPERGQRRDGQDHHHRGSGRIRDRRSDPGADR